LYLDVLWDVSDINLDFIKKGWGGMFGKKVKKKKSGKEIPSPVSWLLKRVILIIILIVAAFFIFRGAYRFLTGWESAKYKNFRDVKIGMSFTLVEKYMGNPDRMSEFNIDQMPVMGFNELKQRAASSQAVKFYYYDNGLRTVYIFGADKKNTLVFKEQVQK